MQNLGELFEVAFINRNGKADFYFIFIQFINYPQLFRQQLLSA